MIHFGIIHATFREQHTLEKVVASLQAAKVDQYTIFADDGRWGAWRNFRRALTTLIAMCDHGDRVCVLLDDCVVRPDILSRLDGMKEEVRTLITIEQDIPHPARDRGGWVLANHGWGSWGGLHVFPAAIARAMTMHSFWLSHLDDPDTPIDAVVFETLRLMGVPVYQHLPSLADHIGETSTLGHGELTPDRRGFRYNEWTS